MNYLTKLVVNPLKLLKNISKMDKNTKTCHISQNFVETTDFVESW